LARAVATHGQTSAVLWTAPRDQEAARRLLKQAIRRHGVPEKSTIDGSAANAAAIQHDHQEHGTLIEIRQITYLHNRVEPDHRGVKWVTRPRLGCKSFEATQATRVGIELMHMLKKGQLVGETRAAGLTPAEPFYALVASPLPQQGSLDHPSKFATEPTRGYWIIPSGRSGAAVSGWVARNHHLHGLVESIIMNVGGCWWNITESER
jgi:hypothetical protein